MIKRQNYSYFFQLQQLSFKKNGRSNRHKTSKDIVVLNSTINSFDLIYIYRIAHSTREECTFFSQ